ncbi:MAG TPA: hypothetical protein VN081_02555 [Dongiaceae bacterium]|nr:hypothetical protein [Dongiaceae bacterium]
MSDQTQSLNPATPSRPDEPTRLTLPMIAERLAQMQIIFTESQEQLQAYIEEIRAEHSEELAKHREEISTLQQKLAKYEDLDDRLKRVERVAANVMLTKR